MSHNITAEIHLWPIGQNDSKVLPLVRDADGSFHLPREGEVIFDDGKPYHVNNIEWRYVDKQLRSVIVNAAS